MQNIHIEGFGITGALLALNLERHAVPFTWSDIDAPHTAWKASTGAVYPAGQPGSHCFEGHASWLQWYHEGRYANPAWLELAHYRFNHKRPPHEGGYRIVQRDAYGLALAEPPALHFNAQLMVPETRQRFADRRIEGARPKGSQVIVAHGFSTRLNHAYWGYTRLVEVDYDGRPDNDREPRSAFYFREGRFIMAYAYPVPGTQYWYAGSKLIKQAAGRFKSLDMPSKYEAWKAQFERLGNGAVKVVGEADYIEGWRPARGDNSWVHRDLLGRIVVPPLWNSGIRHFPVVLRGVFDELGINDPSLQSIVI